MSANKQETYKIISQINEVEGFDPSVLAVEYPNPDDPENPNKRLPVIVQLAWFRLKYPMGRLPVVVKESGDYFVAHARVYADYKDPVEHFLAEATASRKYDPNKPTVSPREWAQTAAVGIALRNAGFGLSFDAAGDGFDSDAVNELVGNVSPDTPLEAMIEISESDILESAIPSAVDFDSDLAVPPTQIPQTEIEISTMETDPLTAAMKIPCPIARLNGKTLGDLIVADQDALVYIANKGLAQGYDPKTVEAAVLICEYAQEQVSA